MPSSDDDDDDDDDVPPPVVADPIYVRLNSRGRTSRCILFVVVSPTKRHIYIINTNYNRTFVKSSGVTVGGEARDSDRPGNDRVAINAHLETQETYICTCKIETSERETFFCTSDHKEEHGEETHEKKNRSESYLDRELS